jgi:hypothetical protein
MIGINSIGDLGKAIVADQETAKRELENHVLVNKGFV